jgi:hypothetical protein
MRQELHTNKSSIITIYIIPLQNTNKDLLFMKTTLLLLLMACSVTACKQQTTINTTAVQAAVTKQLQKYPKSTLKDIYKNFFQDRFGPGHLISDTAVAGAYLRKELDALPVLAIPHCVRNDEVCDSLRILNQVQDDGAGDARSADYDGGYPHAEPTGEQENFYRISLFAVKNGQIPYDTYFQAFIASAQNVNPPTIKDWINEWHNILAAIEAMNLQIENFENDKIALELTLQNGQPMVHHSEIFETTYQPHYRIVSKEIYLHTLLPLLREEK